jgi:hypothetical protein
VDSVAGAGDLAEDGTAGARPEHCPSPAPVKVTFVQRVEVQKGQAVMKYALILFDFDKDTVEARNRRSSTVSYSHQGSAASMVTIVGTLTT